MRLIKSKAFTLIELLVVVAVIAILAAIALPNFLEAQTRSRVARVRSDMRALATALEAYVTDCNQYPPAPGTFAPSYAARLAVLTSPVVYLTSLPADPFARKSGQWNGAVAADDPADMYGYNTDNAVVGTGAGASHHQWSLTSGGPDGLIDFPYYAFAPLFIDDGRYANYLYDPTNGTTSKGDLFRRGGNIPDPLPAMR